MSITPEEMIAKVHAAEAAVAHMKDEVLRRSAFDLILSHSLGAPTAAGTETKKKVVSKQHPSKAKGSPRSSSGRPQQERKISNIELTVDELSSLRDFYDSDSPNGTEENVFTFAKFLHEKINRKAFSDADIYKLYQDLLSLKPTNRPPAMGIEDVKRAISWLLAPSRKKQWLKSLGDGNYEISPKGMLKMTYEPQSKAKNGKGT